MFWRWFAVVVAAFGIAVPSALSQPVSSGCPVTLYVYDPQGAAVAGVQVKLEGRFRSTSLATNTEGRAQIRLPCPAEYRVEIAHPGFEALERAFAVQFGQRLDLEVVLTPELTARESITVTGRAEPLSEEQGSSVEAASSTLKQMPADPARLRDALPMIPGILRSPEGRLQISGAAEHRSSLLVNSMDVTDPATGRFGATVPMDSVAVVNVYKSPFLAEFGRFSAGVVAVDTRRGGDQWRYELNDPTPEFRIRSARLTGVRGFTPRFSFSGPLVRNRVYLAQSAEYALRKRPIFTLQFPRNEERHESWNGLTQVDAIVTPAHLLSVTLHAVPLKINFAQLSFYSPQPTAPAYRGHEVRGSVTDHFTTRGGVLQSFLGWSEVTARVWPQGPEELTIAPAGNLGNYFLSQDRRAERMQWVETFSAAPVQWRGSHHLKLGHSLVRTGFRSGFAARPVNILDFEGQPVSRIEFANREPYSLADWESGSFVQDRWQWQPGLALEAGLRADWQRVTGVVRLAPRLAFSWLPVGERTVLRAGHGWFFDRVPVSVYSLAAYPERRVLNLRGDGSGLIWLPNQLLPVTGSRAPLVWGSTDRPGNFAPYGRTWNVQVDHEVTDWLRLRSGWLETRSGGLVVLRPEWEGIMPPQPRLALRGEGQARYRQWESIARFSGKPGQEVMVSYVRAAVRGNLNEFAEFLGDFPAPVIRPDVQARTVADIPHRLLAWGLIPVTRTVRFAPVVEYRSGFPFSPLNAEQQYAGPPNALRFPAFFSADFRIAKEIHVRKHAVQVSFSMFNVTNRMNPDTVRWNVADPQFGQFFGRHPRRFRVDFDFLY